VNDHHYKIQDFLQNCLQADILDGNLGKVSLDYGQIPYGPAGYLNIVLYLPDNQAVSIFPDSSSYKTLAYLEKLGIKPIIGANPKNISPVISVKL